MFDMARWALAKDRKFLDSVTMAMKFIAWAIPALVTGLKLKHLNMGAGELYRIIESTPVGAWLMAFALVLYYSSWILGAYFDLGMQKDVFIVAADRKLRLQDLGVMLLVAVAFGVLGFFLDRPIPFVALLLCFWIVNFLAWRYLVREIVVHVRRDSVLRHGSEAHYVHLAKLTAVSEYIEGRWQWWRFAIGGILIATLLGVMTFKPEVSGAVQPAVPELLFTAIMFLWFVLVIESWMWARRFATLLRLACLDTIDSEYLLIPRSGAPAPAPLSGDAGDGTGADPSPGDAVVIPVPGGGPGQGAMPLIDVDGRHRS